MRRERDLQNDCIDYLTKRDIYHVNTHGNAFERRGRPDIYICYRGRFIGCELKRGAEEIPTPLQLRHLQEIMDNGGVGIWISTITQLKDLLSSLDPSTGAS